MRTAIMLLALLALCGCSFAVSDVLPKMHESPATRTMHVSFALAPGTTPAPTPAPELLDLSSAVRSALIIPSEIETLERAVIVSCSVLAAIGLINAALLIRLLRVRRRERTLVPTVQMEPIVPTAPSASSTTLAQKLCACGAAISSRSKSGRCRQCARKHQREDTRVTAAESRQDAIRVA
jgi:hypothetical protein